MKAVIFDMFETLVTLHSVPRYFGRNIAADLGADIDEFYPLWHETEEARSKGKMDFEESLYWIGERTSYAHPERIPEAVEKRRAFKAESLQKVEYRIVSLLRELKERGYKVALISNCFLEEAEAIRAGVLTPCFDVMMLSCEQGVQKPEHEIFERCLAELNLAPEECLYVGDGGSFELETARAFGMQTLQAGWFVKNEQEDWRKEGFASATDPEEVLRVLAEKK
ncbi:MAG: HAD family hydrolase [Lachnospiraceae bacterium]|nr:HAD family hydrolase [Lachnospiraceae bacterium]